MLEETLRDWLKDARRVILLGVGNELNGDDRAGVEVVRRAKKRWQSSKNIVLIEAGTVPENFVSVMRDLCPSHIILVDAARMGLQPGSSRIVNRNEITGFSFSTHLISFSFLVNHIEKETNARVVVVGVEPLRTDAGERISRPVMAGIIRLERTLFRVFQPIGWSNARGRG